MARMLVLALALALAACGSAAGTGSPGSERSSETMRPSPTASGGGYYQDQGY